MKVSIYLVALVTFFLLDMLWLGVIASGFYRDQIGFLLKEEANWAAAVVFYLLFVAALSHFAIVPSITRKSVMSAAGNGAFFGLATYAAYDLTNLATTKDWPMLVTVVDLAWGTLLGAVVSVVATKVHLRRG